MLRQDSIILGIGVGIFFFITFFFGLSYLNEVFEGGTIFGQPYYGVRDQFLAILAVVSNILPFLVYSKARKDRSMRGVGIITIILALGVVFYFNLLG